jgi:1-deoxy-D-xylulose-5-phosphate synthase
MRFVKPLDEILLHAVFKNYKTIFTIEDGTIKGGFGAAILEFASKNEYQNKIQVLGIPDNFIEHGSLLELQNKIGLNPSNLASIFSKP